MYNYLSLLNMIKYEGYINTSRWHMGCSSVNTELTVELLRVAVACCRTSQRLSQLQRRCWCKRSFTVTNWLKLTENTLLDRLTETDWDLLTETDWDWLSLTNWEWQRQTDCLRLVKNWLTETDWVIYWSSNSQTYWLTLWLTDLLTELVTDWRKLTDWDRRTTETD